MEEVKQILTKGAELIDKKEYVEANKLFTEGLSKIEGNKNENLEYKKLYYELLLKRSFNSFLQENYDIAEDDVNIILKSCAETQEDPKEKELQIQTLSTAHFRLGQINELRGNLLTCLREYDLSVSLVPDGEGKASLSRVYTDIGLPPISDAPEMAPFLKISKCLLKDENELLEALTDSLKYIKTSTFDAATFSTVGGCRIYFSVMQVYMKAPAILGACIQCLTVLAQKGAQDVYSGYPLIKHVFDFAVINNRPLFALLIQLIKYTPPRLLMYMDKLDFIDPLCDGLTLDLNDEETETVMYLIFHMADKDEQIQKVHNEGVTEICLKKRNNGSFMLLSKLCFVEEACKLAVKEGIIDWTIQFLSNDKSEVHLLLASLTILPEALKVAQNNNNDNNNNDNSFNEMIQKIVPLVVKCILSHTKEVVIVSNGFNVLTFCLPFAKQEIIQLKVIQAASVLLSVHNDDAKTAATIIEFLFDCCEVLGPEEVKKVRPVLQTAMKALNTHANNPLVVEYGAGLAVYLDHHRMNELLQAAMEVCPKSDILKRMKEIARTHKA